MSIWANILQLSYTRSDVNGKIAQQYGTLESGNVNFPFVVRHYLCDWIEQRLWVPRFLFFNINENKITFLHAAQTAQYPVTSARMIIALQPKLISFLKSFLLKSSENASNWTHSISSRRQWIWWLHRKSFVVSIRLMMQTRLLTTIRLCSTCTSATA